MYSLEKKFITKNNCYIANQTMPIVKGLMLHSVGTPQPSANVFYYLFNKPDVYKAVHAFVEPGHVIQMLPWNMRGWHAGGSANGSYIGVEMTEPAGIRYTGGSGFVLKDGVSLAEVQNFVRANYNTAVSLFADLCIEFKLDPLAPNTIISHAEGYKLGVASNHGDPDHLFRGLQMAINMTTFRKDVKAKMVESVPIQAPPTALWRVQSGAYSILGNATKLAAELKSKGFDTYIVLFNGLYKVQTGAYSIKENAEAQARKIKSLGYQAILTLQGGSPVPITAKTIVTATPPQIKVGSRVRVKQGALSWTGEKFSSFVYSTTYIVIQLDGNRAVFGPTSKAVTGAIHKSNLYLV